MHSRSSTADSADSYAAGRAFDSHDQLHHASTRSLGSLPSHGKQDSTDEGRRYGQTSPLARRNGPATATGSAALFSPSTASAKDVTAAVGASSPPPSTHLSGLMCNVHRTTGHEPPPLVGATTTILGDKLYVFGGRILSRSRPAPLTADLYELDLIRRHWSKIDTLGETPPPRYFHSFCPLGDIMMVCYGGMSPVPDQSAAAAADLLQQPEVTVMSDIHIYNVQTRRWTYVPAQDAPQGRYAHCACILPSSAVFSTDREPLSALRPGTSSDYSEVDRAADGTGGAEMVVVGGQDGANHYIEQISVFNLRSLQWTSTQPLGKSCGAYRSVATPLPPAVAALLGRPKRHSFPRADAAHASELDSRDGSLGSSMLIYSNYNFLDVKLELQVRAPDGSLTERIMSGTYSPPGLRFPNGSLIDNHFVVSGTYLTSSKQEYALWALDLRNLTWSRIDAGGNVFSQGSWNRGVLWSRRNTFVILGDRKRSLVDDYNHRRINFTNLCLVELEAFGFYENPRKTSPMSDFVSASSPFPAAPLATTAALCAGGGRQLSKASAELGEAVLLMRELADMEILCVGGERLPANSQLLSHRWGPYFTQLLEEATAANAEGSAGAVPPRPPDSSSKEGGGGGGSGGGSGSLAGNPLRTSSITIKPPSGSPGTDDRPSTPQVSGGKETPSVADDRAVVNSDGESIGERAEAPDPHPAAAAASPRTLPASIRPRCLYLPHTYQTVHALLRYFYTNALPPPQSPLCTPQILCSLLQIARPYRIDGLLEAVVERLHTVLDSRNAAAVFNATAMAAGGGRGVDGTSSRSYAHNRAHDPIDSPTSTSDFSLGGATAFETSSASSADLGAEKGSLPVPTAFASRRPPNEEFTTTTTTTTTTNTSLSISGSERDSGRDGSNDAEEIWRGEPSSVIGLQKRGLRGLMEGRRLRERAGAPLPAALGTSNTTASTTTASSSFNTVSSSDSVFAGDSSDKLEP